MTDQPQKNSHINTKARQWLLGTACVLLVAGALPALSHAHQSAVQSQAGQGGLMQGLLTPAAVDAAGKKSPVAAVTDVRFMDKAAVEAFYEARKNEPYWLKNAGDVKRAREFVALIEESWSHGLNPDRYHRKEIAALIEQPRAETRQKLEMLLTDAAMRYAHDMSGMRVDAGALGLRSKYFRQPMKGVQLAAALAGARDVTAYLKEIAPRSELYVKMQAALAESVAEGAKYDHLLPLNFGGVSMFKPGQSHPQVKKLREYLGLAHDPQFGPENFYDDRLAAAVMNFQRERSLEPDGIIGPATMGVMNRSHKDKINQLVANLERMRWLEQTPPDKYIMVNIPSQRLWAIEKGRVVEEMNVIVGMPSRQTKQFTADATGVRFNPTWTVPLGLKMADFKPKLIRNPGYLHEKAISVSRDGRSIDPHSVDWANVSAREMNQMRFVQRPGNHNALGKIRILMPSDYDIYLHDTNSPEFFERTQRTLSSGCVRMSNPEAVARFILKDNADWSDAKMKELIERGRLVEVQAEKPFPIYIVYQSIWLDDAGKLVFGPDVYGQDKKLGDMLARNNGFAIPQDMKRDSADAGGDRPKLASSD